MLRSSGGFLTIARNNLIKLTNNGETKNRAHDLQIVRANETLKMSHGGSSHRQASGTNRPSKAKDTATRRVTRRLNSISNQTTFKLKILI